MAEQRRRPQEMEIGAILARHPAVREDREGLLDLIYNEVLIRGWLGEHPALADYQARFPELAGSLADLFEVHAMFAEGEDGLTTSFTPEGDGLDDWPPATRPVVAGRDPAPGRPWPALEGYEITAVLGEGGMGIVYRASDLRRGVTVAIKTIRHVDNNSIYRFKQEFRALLGIAHPNLVMLHELISDGRDWFIVMEYVEGVDVLAYVRDGTGSAIVGEPPRPLGGDPGAVDRLRSAFRQVAVGLIAVHRSGKLHRDLKPSNVLVTREGRVVVMDFGLATRGRPDDRDPSTRGDLLGTPAYMAPEQAAGSEATEASDWYCVGSMLFEAITGRLPFQGGPLQILMEKQREEPPPPRSLDPAAPEDLDRLCVDLLGRDPSRRPTGGSFLDRLAPPTPAKPGATTAHGPRDDEVAFIGRESHRAALADARGGLARGGPVVVFIRGPSGVGKSALVQGYLDGLSREVLVLSGRCHERESVPYKALDSLIDALGRHLRRLTDPEVRELLPRDVASLAGVFPSLRRVEAIAAASARGPVVPDPQELRRRSYAAFRELLARIGDRRDLALWIDDLQWGDLDSLSVLSEVLRPPDPPNFLLLCSYRSEEAEGNPFLQGLREVGRADGVDHRDLDVGPLSMDEAADLARHWLGEVGPGWRAGEIARESGGNPFFVAELARASRAGRPGLAATGGLDEVLWSRMVDLPADAMGLLRAVAISGGPLPAAVARLCLDHGGDERSALAVLRAGRMVRAAGAGSPADGERIETYHDRVRESVVGHMTAGERADCHRRLALAYEATGSSESEAVGGHFLAGGEPEKASAHLIEAARRAVATLAFDKSATLFRLAIGLKPPGDAATRSLRIALGDALANAGRGAEAAGEYLGASDGDDGDESLELRRKAAMQWLISGHIDRGLATMRSVLRGVGLSFPATPRRALLSLLARRGILRLRGLGFRERGAAEIPAAELTRVDVCWSAGVGLGNVDWVRGADFQARGLLLALRAGDPVRIGRALAVEAAQSATGGVRLAGRTAGLLARAGELSADAGQPYESGMVALAAGVSSYLEGRWEDALRSCDRAEATFRGRCTGVAWELDTAHAYALWALSHLGRWEELALRFPVLIAEARERGDLYAEMNLSTYILAIVRLAADRPEEAGQEVRRVMAQWSREGYHVQHNDQVWASILVELYRGDGAAAWDSITRHWPTLARSLLPRVQFIRVAMLGVRGRCALAAAGGAGDPTRGPWLGSAGRDAARLEREGLAWASAQARMIRAGLASLQGRRDRVASHLREARDLFVESDMGVCAAVAGWRLGEALGGQEGRALVEQSDGDLRARSIRRPDRVIALFAPGLPR